MNFSQSLLIVSIVVTASLYGTPSTAQTTDHPPAIVAEAESLQVAIDRVRTDYGALESQLPTLSGEDSLITRRQMSELLLTAVDEVYRLADVLARQQAEGLDTTVLDQYVTHLLDQVPLAVDHAIANVEERLEGVREEAEQASPEDLGVIEQEMSDLEAQLDGLHELGWGHVEALERLGRDATEVRKELSEALTQRATLTQGRLRLAMEERDRFQKQASQYPDDVAIRQEADAAQSAVDGAVASLDRTVRTMAHLDIDVTEYRTLIVEATGELSRGLSDAKVAVSLIQKWFKKAGEWLTTRGPTTLVKILLFLAILLAFRLLSRVVRKALLRSIDSSHFQPSQLLRNMLARLSANLVMLLGLLVALSQIGVSLGPVLAGLGVAGFIIGFALQETLANFAAGMMILFYRPFDVGDMVEAGGVTGTVHHMSLVSTTILTIDNQTLIVPNGKIWGDVIRNVTAQEKRRIDLVFGISYSDDIPHAEAVLKSIIDDHDKVLDDPKPVIRLSELADSSVNFIVRPWVKTDDYWDVKWDITREVKIRFDREGIGIPFPQRDVHLYDESRSASVDRGDEASDQAQDDRSV